jgi:galactose-1-phosphate uridylyltransferase
VCVSRITLCSLASVLNGWAKGPRAWEREMDECIFCKIVKREVSASIVYEDDLTLAFMDIQIGIKVSSISSYHAKFFWTLNTAKV